MKKRLMDFLSRIRNRLPSRQSVWKSVKGILKLCVVCSTIGLVLYFTHMWTYEKGQRLGQCEVGCWYFNADLVGIDDDGNCICASSQERRKLRLPAESP
jgi:hypothetical protein